MNLMWIIFAHFIGDWGIQNPWVATEKAKSWMVMIAHCIVWTGCVCIALQWLGLYAFWKLLVLLLGHIIMDKTKCVLTAKGANSEWMMYFDQLFHLLQCYIVSIQIPVR